MFIILTPAGIALSHTRADSADSAKSQFCAHEGLAWHEAELNGYDCCELQS